MALLIVEDSPDRAAWFLHRFQDQAVVLTNSAPALGGLPRPQRIVILAGRLTKTQPSRWQKAHGKNPSGLTAWRFPSTVNQPSE